MNRTVRLAVTPFLVCLMCLGAGCRDKRSDERLATAREVANQAFTVPVTDLPTERPGVKVVDMAAGYGPTGPPPRVFVRVPADVAKADLSFAALMKRLTSRGWGLGYTGDTANACTPEPQALPCMFTAEESGQVGSITVVPLVGGGYELTAAPSR